MADSPAPYQSLYRRYRPQRFSEVRGQDHVAGALRNAVRTARVAHAYLFSGPRGTGKTSAARILAKALNCEAPEDGEPCGRCPSCLAVQAGASLDVLELDAASNNGVDAMRDLVARAALSTPGQWKVYIVDEVHMLSTAASNALLKTLEEPPGHVVFVLATTDPQKVLATIKSRTQHYEFRLLDTSVLVQLLADVNADAGLGLDRGVLERVARKGNGSARDALSALDQVVAAGGVDDEPDVVTGIVEALCAGDAGLALTAAATACAVGRDPRRTASEVIERLRQAFLATLAPALAELPSDDLAAVADQAKRLGTPAVVRAIEVLGEALVAMRDAIDTRVTLEVALVRLCSPQADASVAALVERVDRLERRLAGDPQVAPAAAPGTSEPSAAPSPEAPRASLGAFRRRTPAPEETAGGSETPPSRSSEPAAAGSVPDRDELTKVWGDVLLSGLPPGVRAVFRTGRWLAVEGGTAVFAVPNTFHLERAEAKRREVEAALAAHFGAHIAIRVVEDDGSPASPLVAPTAGPDEPLTAMEVADLTIAEQAPPSAEEHLRAAFPGAEEIST